MSEVQVLRRVFGVLVLVVAGCTGSVRLGAPDPGAVDGGDAGAGIAVDASSATSADAGARAGKDGGTPGEVDDTSTTTAAAGGRDLATDTSRFQGDPRCDDLDALLCDDFESESEGSGPDGAVWKPAFGYTPKIDGSRAARGKKSLHFSVSGTTPGHIEQTRTFPGARGALYGRMFVQFGALPSQPENAHWSIVAALAGENSTEVRVGGQARHDNRFGISSRAPGDSGFDWHTPATETEATPSVSTRWTCLEWYFGADDKETRVWIDGEELTSLHLTEREYRTGDEEGGQPWAFPSLERLRIGWWLYPVENPQPTQYDLWVDEVAIDAARIGCID